MTAITICSDFAPPAKIKSDTVLLSNEILLSREKRNEFESVVVRWMNLDPDIHSEVSQKNKYCRC